VEPVGPAIYGLGLEGKFPLEMSNFSTFFPSGQKKISSVQVKSTRIKGESASYYCRSKVSSGQGPSLFVILIENKRDECKNKYANSN